MAEDWKDRVKRELKAKGLEISDLSTRLDMSKGEVSRLLHGVREPRFSQLGGIAKILDMQLHELIGDDSILVSDERLKKAVRSMKYIPDDRQDLALEVLKAFES